MRESVGLRRLATVGLLAGTFGAALAGLATSAAVAAPDVADPVIVSMRAAPVKGRRVDVTLSVTTTSGGTVTLDGLIAGNFRGIDTARHVRMRKHVRPGTRSVTLKIDPRRARVRRVDGPMVFDIGVSVADRRSPTRAENSVRATIPCPLILLPGFTSETSPGSLDLFATLVDLASGRSYGFNQDAPSMTVFQYDSTNDSLAKSAQGLDAAARQALKGTPFRRVDIVGYSMGGLVARRWLAERGDASGRGLVRKMVFLCTPNEGAPLAYIANTAAAAGTLDSLIGSVPGAGGAALSGFTDALATPEARAAIRNFYPSYAWAGISFFGQTIAIEPGSPFLPDSVSPLTELNTTAPDPDCEFHAIYYTSVADLTGGTPIGTVDKVDVTTLLSGLGGQGGSVDLTNVDLAALASGDGDAVVPAHSVRMDEVPAWKSVMQNHDLGPGFHLTATIDAQASALIALILASPAN